MAPIGATVNMDGTALYYAIAPVFVITMHGVNLGVTQTLLLGYATIILRPRHRQMSLNSSKIHNI